VITEVILVDEHDKEVGLMEKMEAHKKGLLHRAISVFIFNRKGEMLLQQRSTNKYHSGNLWSNACCSHPLPNESTADAAHRRLREEMGFDTEMTFAFSFIYKTIFDNGITEYEFDHVFAGIYDGEIKPDQSEVKDYCYMKMEAIKNSLHEHQHKYTSWFSIAFPKIEEFQKINNQQFHQ
jgi:isopentenyl-diphosphate delta-isomerase